jgi:hypothetical protein
MAAEAVTVLYHVSNCIFCHNWKPGGATHSSYGKLTDGSAEHSLVGQSLTKQLMTGQRERGG